MNVIHQKARFPLSVSYMMIFLMIATSFPKLQDAEADETDFATTEPPMMRGDTAAADNGWIVDPIFTVGEVVNGYQPPGILDGIGAFRLDKHTVRIFVNHELSQGKGYPYLLGNMTELTGARISFFDIDYHTRTICDAGIAYDTVFDRTGAVVTEADQINENGHDTEGFARFCSGQGIEKGRYGFRDNIYFAGEETLKPLHPHGGSVWALDVDDGIIHACPALGRGSWESVTALDTGRTDRVALLLGDDKVSAPLYLWVGRKLAGNDFLDRNGLSEGTLFVWTEEHGDRGPSDFHGKGARRSGPFVPISAVYECSIRGPDEVACDELSCPDEGHDSQCYRDDDIMRAIADNDLQAFFFSRPEDLHTNPENGTEAVLASSGRGGLSVPDDFGAVYRINVNFIDLDGELITADIQILHDGDEANGLEPIIRNPDNLVWADDGMIYVHEDRATNPVLFGAGGIEASILSLNPDNCAVVRIAEMDRSVVVPAGTSDAAAGDLGNWESSGVVDVTKLFCTAPGERLLIADVQAHGIRDGVIATDDLDQGGQLIFLSNINSPADGVRVRFDGRNYRLILTGGDDDNQVKLIRLPHVIAVIGLNGTRVNGRKKALIRVDRRRRIDLNVGMAGGNDRLKLIGLRIREAELFLGDGDDQISIRNSTINDLFVSGGAGIDRFDERHSRIGDTVLQDVELW